MPIITNIKHGKYQANSPLYITENDLMNTNNYFQVKPISHPAGVTNYFYNQNYLWGELLPSPHLITPFQFYQNYMVDNDEKWDEEINLLTQAGYEYGLMRTNLLYPVNTSAISWENWVQPLYDAFFNCRWDKAIIRPGEYSPGDINYCVCPLSEHLTFNINLNPDATQKDDVRIQVYNDNLLGLVGTQNYKNLIRIDENYWKGHIGFFNLQIPYLRTSYDSHTIFNNCKIAYGYYVRLCSYSLDPNISNTREYLYLSRKNDTYPYTTQKEDDSLLGLDMCLYAVSDNYNAKIIRFNELIEHFILEENGNNFGTEFSKLQSFNEFEPIISFPNGIELNINELNLDSSTSYDFSLSFQPFLIYSYIVQDLSDSSIQNEIMSTLLYTYDKDLSLSQNRDIIDSVKNYSFFNDIDYDGNIVNLASSSFGDINNRYLLSYPNLLSIEYDDLQDIYTSILVPKKNFVYFTQAEINDIFN